jgi:hypothetical protein
MLRFGGPGCMSRTPGGAGLKGVALDDWTDLTWLSASLAARAAAENSGASWRARRRSRYGGMMKQQPVVGFRAVGRWAGESLFDD